MPYIPQFNKLSLNEMSYAPALMRQQEDEQVARNMELAEALKFDYLKQDAAGLEPILQKYNTDVEDISKQIAQEGFSHDIKSKVLGLRQKYVGDDKVRHYKKQYADAMSQWDETRKKMLQEGRPGDDINRQKEQFFSAYAGGYDPEGKFKNEFTPGRTSGYYDIGEDATKLMSNLGTTETPIVGENASIQYVAPKDGQPGYFMTKDFSRNGAITRNTDQVAAVKQYLKAEYGNDKTDRGLFAKISKLDPSYIDNVVDQIGTAKTSYRKEAPLVNTGYSGFGSGAKSTSGFEPSTYLSVTGKPGVQDIIKERSSTVLSGVKNGKFDPKNIPSDSGAIPKIKEEAYDMLDAFTDFLSPAWSSVKDIAGFDPEYDKNNTYFEEKKANIKSSTRDKAEKTFNKAKSKYSVLYDQIKKSGGDDSDFIKTSAAIESNEAVNIGKNIGLNSPNGVKALLGKLWEMPDSKTFINTTDEDDSFSRTQFEKKAKELDITAEQLMNRAITVDAKGNILLQIPDKKGKEVSTYRLNRESLPEEMKTNEEAIKTLEHGLTNYGLSKSQLDNIQNIDFNLYGNKFKVNIDPENSFMRSLNVVLPDGSEQRVSLSYIHMLNAQKTLEALSAENK